MCVMCVSYFRNENGPTKEILLDACIITWVLSEKILFASG